MIGPGSSKNRTKYTPSYVVLTLICLSHHNPSSPFYPKWAPFRQSRVAVVAKPLRAWDKRSPAPKNHRRCPGKAQDAPWQCPSGGIGGWFGGAGPECRPNNANCGCERVRGPLPASRTIRRVPPNASCIPQRLLHLAPGPDGGR